MFASGAGTNFKALLLSRKRNKIKSDISLLISNNSDCGAVKIAKESGINCKVINKNIYPGLSDKNFDELFLKELKKSKIDFIVLAGYMKLLNKEVLRKYKNRIINVHPALLPSFGGKGMYGANVHRAVIASGVKVSGITIHFVNEKYDEGKIIFQKCCDVDFEDDENSLSQKIRKLEHKYYPEIIKKFEDKKVLILKNKVKVI